jgi:transposase-like protein
MKRDCPRCGSLNSLSGKRTAVVRAGFFKRQCDSKRIQRFRCLKCLKYFSHATFHPFYRQKKRKLNFKIAREISSSVSFRRVALNFKISRTTVKRKFLIMGRLCGEELKTSNLLYPKAHTIEFDDLETFEHSKCKPLSVTLAVEHQTRRILAFEVSKMPAKGKLAKIAFKKYGVRKDERSKGREKLFKSLKPLVQETALIKSDQNPFYPGVVKRHFPKACHEMYKGQRGSITGQGELKKIRFDPLFSLNHTCAMLRANINRLVRRTWCTTKLPENLKHHISIYAVFHNKVLLNSS